MEHITVAEHLESMQEGEAPSWLVELANMLQEIEGLDSALAASMAYDLARDPENARALHQLIQGCASMRSILTANDLTSMQAHTVQKTIYRLGMNLLALSSSDLQTGFQTSASYAVEKEK